MSDIVTLNGYNIKDEKAVRSYETVAEMKADTKLKEGYHVKTKGYYEANDGGHGEYVIIDDDTLVSDNGLIHVLDNELRAKLIIENDVINVKQFGIVNNTTDVGSIINKITNDLNYKVYVPTGEYLVTTTIEPSGRKELIIDGNLTYTGNDSCIKISTQFNKISTQKITSSGICILFENNNSLALCQNNDVKLNDIVESTTTHALVFHSINQGVTYNNIKFTTLRAEANSYCIYLKTEATGTYSRYVAETTIKGGQCTRGLYAIYIDTNTTGSAGEVTGMHFETISCEGVTNGIYIKNARGNNFDYIRVGELSGHYIKIDSNARNNVFNLLSPITYNKIDLSTASTSAAYLNIINARYAASGGSLLANKLILTRQHILPQELFNRSYKNVTSYDDNNEYHLTTDETKYYILITANNGSVILNEYYDVNGINEFWVESSRTFTLIDNAGTTICTGTAGSTIYLFHCTCYDQNDTRKWIVEKMEK